MRYDADLKDFLELTVTQTFFGKLVGVSQQRINQLIEEEVVIRDESDKRGGIFLFDSLKNFYLSNKTSSDGVNYWQEKARHEKVKREQNELKLQQMQGEVYSAADIDAALAEILVALRNNLLGLPAKFATQLENKNREEINQILTAEIEDKLVEISNFKPSDINAKK